MVQQAEARLKQAAAPVNKRLLAIIFATVLALRILLQFYPDAPVFFVLYPGIIVEFGVGNVHDSNQVQHVFGVGAGIVTNFLFYWGLSRFVLRFKRFPS